MISFGLSQMLSPRCWIHYVPKLVDGLLPISKRSVIRLHGTGNLSLGVILLVGYGFRPVWTMNAAWWANVAIMCGRKDWKTGLRDMAILSAIIGLLISLGDES